MIKSRVGKGKIMKNVRAAARIGASCSQRLKAVLKMENNSLLFIKMPYLKAVFKG
jgi:hypothetical protein